MQSVNWAWGLSLTALTLAIHTMGVVLMAVAGLRIRARLETRNLGFWHAILIVIGVVGTAGLLLAVLHGIEAAIWRRHMYGSARSTCLKMRSSILSTL